MVPSKVWKPEESKEWILASSKRLGGSVKVPTISYDGMPLNVTSDPRFQIFDAFHDYLRETFPLVHSRARITKVNHYGLVFEFKGSDQSLKPALYAGHQDVVPVPSDTLDQWKFPPFEGHYDVETDLLWGRGSSDDKNMLIGILEALERLLEEGFENSRTILVASGFDEEVGGPRGAGKIGLELERLYGKGGDGKDYPFEFVLDEGGLGVGEEQGIDIAMPAVAEKGYTDIKVEIRTLGGHSAVPPDHTAIGILSSILKKIEDNPHKPSLTPRNPILTHLICLAEALESNVSSQGRTQKASDGEPKKWNEVAARIAREGTRTQKYVLQTSQAIDVVNGGLKANALPESASAVINHRIAVDSSLFEIQHRLEGMIRPLAESFGLKVIVGGEQQEGEAQDPAGTLRITFLTSSEPTPVSPWTNAQFGRLASTIRHVFPGKDGRERLVTPVVMTGNTDLRHYLNLSQNLWRFNPNTYMMNSNKHTVGENMNMYAHAQTARFIHALIRNTDEAL
ncbi:Zn-dependent exopeptidase [Violaceomyces palustris]|uniref:Zn-dependent exopeptidase n=1 Tax=Violaceomyces palustris TaxID=1673888 RepID=A0ACD0NWH6_9BASI|nr:Zn-dependent exopeptidase [Violaceomyces palustris]